MNPLRIIRAVFESRTHYHSVFYQHKGQWRHHSDSDSAEDARSDRESIKYPLEGGKIKTATLRVPKADARWHTMGPDTLHNYVENRLKKKTNESLNEVKKEKCATCDKPATGSFDTGHSNIPICSDCTKAYGSDHYVTAKLNKLMTKKRSPYAPKNEGKEQDISKLRQTIIAVNQARHGLHKLHAAGKAINKKGLTPEAEKYAATIRAAYGGGKNVVSEDTRSKFKIKRLLRQDFGKTATGPKKSVVPNQTKYINRTKVYAKL